ncbi:MAG: translation initiation factor IF-2 [Nanoarchaeota archaeon]|nr:translation initiation factor IF-2 [Nanoarchaeota archaeon]
MLRKPIITFLGHVDHGKSSLIEKISAIGITKGEPGLITQGIRSYKVAKDAVEKIAGKLLPPGMIKVPGFLLIDSPGHAAFNNLRKRGGNLADVAILVVDLNQGMQDQTLECIEILRAYKTPFVIAANKVDLIAGWHNLSEKLLENIGRQRADIQAELDKRLYTMVGKLVEFQVNAERFDRVDDFTKAVAIVPCSALSGEGLPELLMVIAGLSQRFLEKKLDIDLGREGKGTVLEVKEEKGLGTTLDVVLYDGCLKVNDQLVIGTLDEPLVTKVKGLFDYEGKKLVRVQEVVAATGVRVLCPEVKSVIGGVPFRVANTNLEQVKAEVKEEVEQVVLEVDPEGIVVKADTLGSLEALLGLLRKAEIKLKRASIGAITKKDVAEALANADPLNRVVVGFNVDGVVVPEVKILTANVIYRIIDDLALWRKDELKKMEAKELEKVMRAFKMQVLPGCIFRQSNPAVVGVRVFGGIVKNGVSLMKSDGSKVSYVKSLQKEKETVDEAKKDDELAISIPDVMVGRQLHESDILFADLDEQHFTKLKSLRKYLKEDEIEVLKEIAEIKRKSNPVWGI